MQKGDPLPSTLQLQMPLWETAMLSPITVADVPLGAMEAAVNTTLSFWFVSVHSGRERWIIPK